MEVYSWASSSIWSPLVVSPEGTDSKCVAPEGATKVGLVLLQEVSFWALSVKHVLIWLSFWPSLLWRNLGISIYFGDTLVWGVCSIELFISSILSKCCSFPKVIFWIEAFELVLVFEEMLLTLFVNFSSWLAFASDLSIRLWVWAPMLELYWDESRTTVFFLNFPWCGSKSILV